MQLWGIKPGRSVQGREMEEAAGKPIIPDEDSPELILVIYEKKGGENEKQISFLII